MGRATRTAAGSAHAESLDSAARAECEALLARVVRDSDSEQIAELSRLLERTLAELALMLGDNGAAAIARRSLQLVRPSHPVLSLVGEGTGRYQLGSLQGPSANRAAVRAALGELFRTTVAVTSSLIGYDLVRPMVNRVAAQGEYSWPGPSDRS